MKDGVLRGALVFGVLSCLFFVVCFSSGGVFYLLFGFALIYIILCWDPINNEKNNEPPFQKKNAVPRETKKSTLSSCSMTYRTLQLNIIFAKMLIFFQRCLYSPLFQSPMTHTSEKSPPEETPFGTSPSSSLSTNLPLTIMTYIPITELLDNPAAAGHQLSYQVRKKPSAKSKGTLNLSYKFGDRVKVPATEKVAKTKNDEWDFTGNGYCAVLPSFALSTDHLCSYHSHHFSFSHH